MADPARRIAPHRSVFVRLIATMVAMAVCALAMVSAFYFWVLVPGLHSSMNRFVEQHVRAIAATSPDLASARRLAASLDMEVRYEGPAEAWTTADEVPSVAGLVGSHPAARPGYAYYVLRAPQGGHYVFVRAFGGHIYDAHTRMLLVLLGLMIAIFLTAYFVLRRTLRPLRALGAGVARLGEGDLDVTVPNPGRDEFGALTDAFNRMARRVKEMIGARDRLLLDVSHELRSPLTRLRVALELLPSGAKRSGMVADVAEMETMVTELLEMERLRDGRGIHTERQDLRAILGEVAASYAERAPGVRFAPPRDDLPADIDADRVRIVLRNVLENAIKYSLPDSRAVEVTAATTPDRVVVRVTDDGPGIPPDEAERLFEPFFRLDRSRSKKTGGYGLGLSICKRIMEAHGGSITVERNPGRGATFVLGFPRAG